MFPNSPSSSLPDAGRRPPLPALLWLASLYAFWGGSAFLADLAGAGEGPSRAMTAGSSIGHILLAAWVTSRFAAVSEAWIGGRPRLRTALLLALAVAGAVLAFLPGEAGPWRAALGSANLLALALVLGTWLSAPLTRPAELVPVCAVMSFADIYSVLRGPTAYLAEGIEQYYRGGMEGPAPIGDYLLVKVAVPGLEAPMPLFGVADWVIVVFLASAALKFGMDDVEAGWRPGLAAGAAGLLLAVGLAQGLGLFIPALPVVALVFLGVTMVREPQVLRLVRSDWVCLGAAGVVLGVLLAVGP